MRANTRRVAGFGAAILIAALLSYVPTVAYAQAADEEAHSLFQAAQSAYTQGEYRRALDYFRRAYELSDRPALLFNIGSAQDRLHNDEQALAAYRQYLELDPDGTQAQFARNRIRNISARLSSTETAPRPDAPPPAEAPQASHVPGSSSEPSDEAGPELDTDEGGGVLPIILAATGGALVIASIGTLVWWISSDGLVTDCNEVGCLNGEELVSQRNTAMGLTIAFGVLGLAAITTGVILWLSGGSDDDPESASLMCAPGLFGVGCSGRF